MSLGEAAQPEDQASEGARPESSLWPLTGYFLKLGAIGFGGPAALVGYMHRDLVERRRPKGRSGLMPHRSAPRPGRAPP